MALFQSQTGPFYTALGNERLFQVLCEKVIERSALVQNRNYATNTARVENREALMAELRAISAGNTRAHWLGHMLDAGLPAGAVRTVSESLNAPEVAERGMLTHLSHPMAGTVRLVNPLRFSQTPVAEPTAPPLLGQHTETVLQDILGYDAARIEHLQQERAIR